MKKIILSLLVILGIAFASQSVLAANASLYISPASATKDVSSTFNISAGVSTQGNKVCVVEGRLVFDNLTCENITVANGFMAQTSPTCSDPHFVLGIPTCTTADKNLFTISVKAGSIGSASANFTGAGIIGVGVIISSDSTGGNYTIKAALPTPTPVHTPTPTPKPQKPTPTPKASQNNVQTNGQNQNGQGNNQGSGNNLNSNRQLAGIANASGIKAFGEWAASNIVWIIILILIILILSYIIWKPVKKKK